MLKQQHSLCCHQSVSLRTSLSESLLLPEEPPRGRPGDSGGCSWERADLRARELGLLPLRLALRGVLLARDESGPPEDAVADRDVDDPGFMLMGGSLRPGRCLLRSTIVCRSCSGCC